MILPFVRRLAPIASQARHFPRQAGTANNQGKRIRILYLYTLLMIILCRILRSEAHDIFSTIVIQLITTAQE